MNGLGNILSKRKEGIAVRDKLCVSERRARMLIFL